MGNEKYKMYTISKTPLLSTGFQSLWKVYSGFHKERNQDVCIFYLDKKSLKSLYKSKSDRLEIINLLKKDVVNLIKYSSSQSQNDFFLSIIEPLIEDKASMGFITEPFQSTLNKWCELTSPSKLEIKLMIKEVCNGISYLHKTHQIVHCDINSNNIFVTKSNRIKIFGLCFSQLEGKMIKYTSHSIIPNLNYASPEIVIDHEIKFQSDTFSIGLLVYFLLKRYLNDKTKHFLNSPKDVNIYKDRMKIDNYNKAICKLDFIDEDNEFLLKVINRDASCRPSIDEMLSMPWFNDPKLKSLYFLDNLDSNDCNKTLVFIEQLPNYISHYENRVIERRLLPSLLKALEKENMMSVVLPCLFTICELPMIKIKFEALIWPKIKQLFQLKSLPASTLLTIISKIAFFGQRLSEKEFSDNFLNVIAKGLESNVSKIHSVIVDNMSYLVTKLDQETFQSKLYPRLMTLLTKTTSNDIRAKILNGIKEMYSSFEHNSINDSLLSALASLIITENSSEVCINIALLYDEIAKNISVETIATSMIPQMLILLMNGNVTKNGFDLIMKSVMTDLDRIRTFREKNLVEDKSVVSLIQNDSRIGNSKIIMMNTMNEGYSNKDNDFFASFFNNNTNDVNNAVDNNIKEGVENKINSLKKLYSTDKDFDLLAQTDLSFEPLDEKQIKMNSALQFQLHFSNKEMAIENILQFTEEDNIKLKQAKENNSFPNLDSNMYHHHSYNQDLIHFDDSNNILDNGSYDNANNNHQRLSQENK